MLAGFKTKKSGNYFTCAKFYSPTASVRNGSADQGEIIKNEKEKLNQREIDRPSVGNVNKID